LKMNGQGATPAEIEMQRYTQPNEPNHPAYTPAKYQE